MSQIESVCPNFKILKDSDKVFYMLTCENECVIKVSKFLNLILSSHTSVTSDDLLDSNKHCINSFK